MVLPITTYYRLNHDKFFAKKTMGSYYFGASIWPQRKAVIFRFEALFNNKKSDVVSCGFINNFQILIISNINSL